MRALTSLTTRSAMMRSRSESDRPVERLGRLADRHVADLGDGVPVDGDRRAAAGARRAPPHAGHGHLPHVALDLLALVVALGLAVPALEVGDDALEVGGVRAHAAVAVLVADLHLAHAGAVQERLLLLLGELRPGRVGVGAQLLGHRLDQALEVLAAAAGPRARWRPRPATGRGWGRSARGRPRSGCRGRRTSRRRRRAS